MKCFNASQLLLLVLFGACASPSKVKKGDRPQESLLSAAFVEPKTAPEIVISALADKQLILKGSLRFKLKVSGLVLGPDQGVAVAQLNDGSEQKIFSSDSEIELKEGLVEGSNWLRVFLRRPGGEIFRNDKAFRSIHFSYIKKGNDAGFDSPYWIVLGSPGGSYTEQSGAKIAFDFLTDTAANSKKKVMIRYTLNRETREVSGVPPYYFYNLPKGKYTLNVFMVEASGKRIENPKASAYSVFSIVE